MYMFENSAKNYDEKSASSIKGKYNTNIVSYYCQPPQGTKTEAVFFRPQKTLCEKMKHDVVFL